MTDSKIQGMAKNQGVDPPRLRRAYFESRHGQLHVHNAIPVGGGFDEMTTLICLHGAGTTGRSFVELSKRLGRTRSIYNPDLPGCGESDGPEGKVSAGADAEAIGDFLDSMRFRQVDLLGAGTGAAVAVELALLRPKVARKVVLLGTIQPEGWRASSRLPLLKQPLLDAPEVLPQQVEQAEGKMVSRLLEFLA
jgi:pimeloyl-ACP methyl ester carboxylesterase